MMKFMHSIYCVLLLGFLLGVHNGNIAIWKDDDPTPLRVFPYRAELLPKEDYNALIKGIHINSMDELGRLLEDFLS